MSVKDLTDDEILYHLKNNTILRNGQLSILVKLLNSLKDSSTLAIDGAWGSGKTVFVKQLMMLADSNVEDYGHNTLDGAAIETLRENQKTFYFNAWENDYLGDALGAILLKLIAENDPSLNVESLKRVFSAISPGAALKKVSFDLYNPDGKPRKDKLIEDIKPIVNRHDAVNDFINAIKGDNKRLIFVIDELDRCKPSFAIDLLEVVKHYFVRDDVTFIIATNINELSHTIKRYYGEQFDGYGYLNKFFDFNYSLKDVDIKQYAKDTIDWVFDGGMVSGVTLNAITYYGFQLREINSYISALKLVDGFINDSRTYGGGYIDDSFVKGLLVPFALALKIKNNGYFSQFIKGTKEGAQILRNFAESSSEMKDFAKGIELHSVDVTTSDAELDRLHMDAFIELYYKLFGIESKNNRSAAYHGLFLEAVSLLSSYTSMDEIKGEGYGN